MSEQHRLDELRRVYDEGGNLMSFLRQKASLAVNTEEAILAAYDMQAGSYVAALADPQVYELNRRVTRELATILDRLGTKSVLNAGCGEAKTISHVLDQMSAPPERSFAFDIALSRLLVAKRYARSIIGPRVSFFMAAMSAIPVQDNAFDAVLTSHALEPNGGKERELLGELLRVSRQWLVLREPSWELGGEATRGHIEKHGYVRGLAAILGDLGAEIVEHRLFGVDDNPRNQSALILARKRAPEPGTDGERWIERGGEPFVSPISGAPLMRVDESYYAPADGYVFPVFASIPCLRAESAIFCSRYLDFRDE